MKKFKLIIFIQGLFLIALFFIILHRTNRKQGQEIRYLDSVNRIRNEAHSYILTFYGQKNPDGSTKCESVQYVIDHTNECFKLLEAYNALNIELEPAMSRRRDARLDVYNRTGKCIDEMFITFHGEKVIGISSEISYGRPDGGLHTISFSDKETLFLMKQLYQSSDCIIKRINEFINDPWIEYKENWISDTLKN